jgi:hypothetical protein
MNLIELKFTEWFKEKFKKDYPVPLEKIKHTCANKGIEWLYFVAETILQTEFYRDEFIDAKNLWGTKSFIDGKSVLIRHKDWGAAIEQATNSFLKAKRSLPAMDFVKQINAHHVPRIVVKPVNGQRQKPNTSPWSGGWGDQSSGQGSHTGGVVVTPAPIKTDPIPSDLSAEISKILGYVRTYIGFSITILSPASIVFKKLRPIVAALRAILEVLKKFK